MPSRSVLLCAATLGQALFVAAFAPPPTLSAGPLSRQPHLRLCAVACSTPPSPHNQRRPVERRHFLGVGFGILAHITLKPLRVFAEDEGDEIPPSAAAVTPPVTPQSVSATALFSGGDARFLQAIFETKRDEGVLSTSIGRTGDGTRAVQVSYDPAKISYKKLLGVFWHEVDPTDGGGQFKDRGKAFRPVIYVRCVAHAVYVAVCVAMCCSVLQLCD